MSGLFVRSRHCINRGQKLWIQNGLVHTINHQPYRERETRAGHAEKNALTRLLNSIKTACSIILYHKW
jgi:hypothetical protein